MRCVTFAMKFAEGKIETHENVAGEAGGVTQVRSTMTMAGDGSFHVKAEYMKDGAWQVAREATYREDATATVVFR